MVRPEWAWTRRPASRASAASLKLAHTGDRGPSVHDGRGAHRALAASVGLRGDASAVSAPSLAPAMQVRAGQQRTELARKDSPTPTPTPARTSPLSPRPLPERAVGVWVPVTPRPIRSDWLPTWDSPPVLIRYNTGLRVSHNGAHLADLLDDLIEAWRCRCVDWCSWAFDGGLVVHSAMVALAHGERTWTNLVSDTVTTAHLTTDHPWPVAPSWPSSGCRVTPTGDGPSISCVSAAPASRTSWQRDRRGLVRP